MTRFSDSPCSHPVASDHWQGRHHVSGRPLWKCSDCGHVDTWRDGWGYLGRAECPDCKGQVVDRVACPRCSGFGRPGVRR